MTSTALNITQHLPSTFIPVEGEKFVPDGDKKDVKQQIGLRLEAALAGLEINQTEVADYLGVSPNRINQYIRGKRFTDVVLMTKICERYGVTLDWIYRGDPSGLKSSVAEKIINAYNHATPAE